MKGNKVYLTFETDRKTSEELKWIAKSCKMTQPELINEICNDFIENINKLAEENLKKEGRENFD